MEATGHVEDYRVPPGCVAITADVKGADPITVAIEAEHLAELIEGMTAYLAHIEYYQLAKSLAHSLVLEQRRRKPSEDVMTGAGMTAMWLVLHHPQRGHLNRAAIAELMAAAQPVHVTWHYQRNHGAAIAIADQFVDLEHALAKATRTARFDRERPPPGKRH